MGGGLPSYVLHLEDCDMEIAITLLKLQNLSDWNGLRVRYNLKGIIRMEGDAIGVSILYVIILYGY